MDQHGCADLSVLINGRCSAVKARTQSETIRAVTIAFSWIQKLVASRQNNVYTRTKLIFWNEPKRLANLIKRGFDFADLDEAFFLGAVVIPVKFNRHMAIGRMNDRTIAVVFTHLGSEGFQSFPCGGQTAAKGIS